MEESPIKLSIGDIVAKAEEFYRDTESWKAPNTYETAIEQIKDKILKLQEISKIEFKKDLSIADIIHEIITVDGVQEDARKTTIHLSILAGYKIEQERQKEKENKQDAEAIVRLVLKHLAYFSLPPGSTVTVMSMEELEEAIRENNAEINKSLIKLFFMNGWIYYPLSLPFVIVKIIWLICVIIKPAIREVKKLDMSQAQSPSEVNIKKVNFKAIMEEAENRMPKIMDFEYFGHHIVCGILMWIIILKWIF